MRQSAAGGQRNEGGCCQKEGGGERNDFAVGHLGTSLRFRRGLFGLLRGDWLSLDESRPELYVTTVAM
jgi:hypothetical protein